MSPFLASITAFFASVVALFTGAPVAPATPVISNGTPGQVVQQVIGFDVQGGPSRTYATQGEWEHIAEDGIDIQVPTRSADGFFVTAGQPEDYYRSKFFSLDGKVSTDSGITFAQYSNSKIQNAFCHGRQYEYTPKPDQIYIIAFSQCEGDDFSAPTENEFKQVLNSFKVTGEPAQGETVPYDQEDYGVFPDPSPLMGAIDESYGEGDHVWVDEDDSKRVADIKQLQLALELYFDAYATYPSRLSGLADDLFISKVPTDPQTGLPYEYKLLGGGTAYVLRAGLETNRFGATAKHEACPSTPERAYCYEGRP